MRLVRELAAEWRRRHPASEVHRGGVVSNVGTCGHPLTRGAVWRAGTGTNTVTYHPGGPAESYGGGGGGIWPPPEPGERHEFCSKECMDAWLAANR